MISDKTVDIIVQSREASYSAAFTAVVTHIITDYQPHFNINATSWRIPQKISLADPHFNQSQRIDLLVGAGLFFGIISMGQIHLNRALLTLQNTKLGWTVSGKLSSNMPTHKSVLQASIKDPADHSDNTLVAIVKRFWETWTSLRPSHLYFRKTCECEQLFTESCTRLGNGQYSLRLLSTSGFESRRRFKSLEAKLDRNPALKAQYSAFLREYIDLGHMSLVTKEPSETQFFLPHHCVH